jgi:hypothetical protein
LARLTYGIVVAALAALVSGFFVKTSTLPLIASIGLSALATAMILVGWGRRLRLEQERGGPLPERTRRRRGAEPAPPPEPQVEDIETVPDDDDAPYRPPRERAPRRPRRTADAVVELPADAELTYELPAAEEPPPRTRARPEPARPRPAPVQRRAQTRVVVIPGRGRYHTHSCRFARRDDAVEMTVATARRRGYEACSVCAPDDYVPV